MIAPAFHPTEDHASSPASRLKHALEHAAHYLPAQGPIGVFVHHNTLHAFQHLPFEQAVTEAARSFQTEPYFSEEAYQEQRARGRILKADIDAVLAREEDAEILPHLLTRRQLRKALLVPGVRRVNRRNIAWQVEEGGLLEHFREDLPPTAARALASDSPARLWKVCCQRMPAPKPSTPPLPQRPRDALLALPQRVDLDQIVHPPLIRITGAFLDQGVAYWPMPLKELGLLGAVRTIMGQSFAIARPHLSGVPAEFRRQEQCNLDAASTVLEMLGRLGVSEPQWDSFIQAELLALPGWAGMIHCLEKDPTLAPHERICASLMEFLAVRLTYTVVALDSILGDAKSWKNQTAVPRARDPLVHQARLFDAAQLVGLSSFALASLSDAEFATLCKELEWCNEIERRRLLHLAYERRHERQILVPLSKHRALPPVSPPARTVTAQILFCIDEREESFRRALEEQNPDIETYGAAGFFGCAINYAGIDDAGGVSLCPVVVKPAHEVRETPLAEDSLLYQKRKNLRRVWAKLVRQGSISSRTLFRGSLSTALIGFLSLFPLAFRLLSPRGYSRLVAQLNALFLPEPRTELTFMRDDHASRDATTGLMKGFSTEEMADRVAGVLGPTGLRNGHARLVVVLGHGSTSLNNPHESAYDCGACGGRRGGPNARVFAAMANRKDVRAALRSRGISVPEDSWFVGGYHDTCCDHIDLYDTDQLPHSHHSDLERLRRSLDKARAFNAHERSRRFEAAGHSLDPEAGLRHVQERSEHLGESRPEYGHSTNAVAIVGRREHTRGLFFDRRAFLISYDALSDPEDKALAAVLGAVIPVCGGINLEYYFSSVDNEGYGCGTKLPHNISALVGVMNGYQGDLRTGLPLQTVEIHEPVRILFVIESTPKRLMQVVHQSPILQEFVENRWIRLATMDPEDGSIEIYRGHSQWEPLTGDEEPLPVAESSMAYYSGKLDHLPVARIEPPHPQVA
ncbi:MAG: hypothetical protein RLZZ399_916 [Verrucomicrobiota bacterium]|jgi:uncharacterized protein YbcC (UPF0753/DUF2309 family)